MQWLAPDLGPGVTAVVTTRAGGVSEPPYDTLDLGYHVGDDAEAVAANRARVAGVLGRPVVYANQVHGTHALVVREVPDPAHRDVGDADALVTSLAGVALAVMVADCLPVLLADPGAGVVGVAHAGRRGMADGVVRAAVGAMTGLGATPAGIRAYLGPAICGSCYEVGSAVQAEVVATTPEAASTTSRGTPGVDLVAGVVAQLRREGVVDVERCGICTVEDGRFYSYRRDGRTGRFAGLVALTRDTP